MRLYLLFWKWKIYGFCLRVPHSRNKAFMLTVGWPSFLCLESAWKQSIWKNHCIKYNGYLNLMGWINTSLVLTNGLRVPRLYFKIVVCAQGPRAAWKQPVCAAGQHEELRTLLCCFFCAWREHGGLHTLIAADLSPHPYEVLFSVWWFTYLLFGLRSMLPSATECNTELSTAAPSPACGSGIGLAVAGRSFACLTSKVWFVHVLAVFLLSAAEEGKWGGVCTQPLTQGWGKRRWLPREGRNYRELPN